MTGRIDKASRDNDAPTLFATHGRPATESSLPVVRRLSLRLSHLYEWACDAGAFNDIWDLCCDHGRLGLHLHQTLCQSMDSASTRIHLIDRVPRIISELQEKYSHLVGPSLTIQCADAGEVALPANARQLVIIAGVGGETIAKIIEKLVERRQTADACQPVEFILSPNQNAFELRRFLRQANFDFLREEFVTDKGWAHEHLHVRYCSGRLTGEPVSVVGEALWQDLTKQKERYLQKQLQHYRSCLRLGGRIDVRDAVDAYGSVLRI